MIEKIQHPKEDVLTFKRTENENFSYRLYHKDNNGNIKKIEVIFSPSFISDRSLDFKIRVFGKNIEEIQEFDISSDNNENTSYINTIFPGLIELVKNKDIESPLTKSIEYFSYIFKKDEIHESIYLLFEQFDNLNYFDIVEIDRILSEIESVYKISDVSLRVILIYIKDFLNSIKNILISEEVDSNTVISLSIKIREIIIKIDPSLIKNTQKNDSQLPLDRIFEQLNNSEVTIDDTLLDFLYRVNSFHILDKLKMRQLITDVDVLINTNIHHSLIVLLTYIKIYLNKMLEILENKSDSDFYTLPKKYNYLNSLVGNILHSAKQSRLKTEAIPAVNSGSLYIESGGNVVPSAPENMTSKEFLMKVSDRIKGCLRNMILIVGLLTTLACGALAVLSGGAMFSGPLGALIGAIYQLIENIREKTLELLEELKSIIEDLIEMGDNLSDEAIDEFLRRLDELIVRLNELKEEAEKYAIPGLIERTEGLIRFLEAVRERISTGQIDLDDLGGISEFVDRIIEQIRGSRDGFEAVSPLVPHVDPLTGRPSEQLPSPSADVVNNPTDASSSDIDLPDDTVGNTPTLTSEQLSLSLRNPYSPNEVFQKYGVRLGLREYEGPRGDKYVILAQINNDGSYSSVPSGVYLYTQSGDKLVLAQTITIDGRLHYVSKFGAYAVAVDSEGRISQIQPGKYGLEEALDSLRP